MSNLHPITWFRKVLASLLVLVIICGLAVWRAFEWLDEKLEGAIEEDGDL